GDARQTLDLHMPPAKRPPLLIFVHGGFWSEGDERYNIGNGIVRALVPQGVAVALVRYRLASPHQHPAQILDVAAAFAHLVRSADRYGYDSKRIYIAGHSAGGHLASLLALDERYLAAHDLTTASIAGVIGISGVYNLDTHGVASYHKEAVQRTFGDLMTGSAASPSNFVRAGAPPFLILNPENDLPRLQLQAREFVEALSDKKVEVDYLVVPGLDHLSIARPEARSNPLEHLMLWRMGVAALPETLESLRAARRIWLQPPLSTQSFWQHYPALIESRPVDKRFRQALSFLYQDTRYELRGWPLQRYHRIELMKLLEASDTSGDYVVLRNALDEVQVWHRSEIETYKPVIVVGLDEEKNLFRLHRFYRMKRQYSWQDTSAPPMMVLPLGAFVYFEEVPPPRLKAQLWHYSLTSSGISRSATDPLAAVRGHLPELLEVITAKNGCMYCHMLGTTGSRAHHLTAREAQAHGGYALPLENYPAEVIDAFLDHQEETALKMGATPNAVDKSVRHGLRALIVQHRKP
ncbi:MAG TPA: alpha/beta hydrolase, partial [Burkholderiales bacterium]|nr:alpha/beta hydrolase [Burkholderiales bacterium]